MYGGASYSLAARILGIGADAEDSVVDAFRELVRLQRLHDHTDLRALILLITRNASVKKLRQRHGRPVHDAAIMHAGSAASLSQALRTADDLEACAALAGLDPTRRLVEGANAATPTRSCSETRGGVSELSNVMPAAPTAQRPSPPQRRDGAYRPRRSESA